MERYLLYLSMDSEVYEPKITNTFKLTQPTNTNAFYSTTEDTAIKRIDAERKRKEYIKKIQKAVNRLNLDERSAIIKRYLESDNIFDYEVYNELGYSERKYYRIKSKAFYKLAFILRVAVYKEGG